VTVDANQLFCVHALREAVAEVERLRTINAELLAALRKIDDGLSNTKSVRGAWSTRQPKIAAWEIAHEAIAKAEAVT
jgi:hypothetical protein